MSINPRTGVEVVGASLDEAPSHGLLIDYRHPLSRMDRSANSKKLLGLGRWTAEFDPGPMAEEVYDDVDWYFLPIGSFGQLERTGPHIRIAVVPVKVGKRLNSEDLTGPKIRVGKVPIKAATPGLDSAVFFGVLYGILLGAEKVEAEDWTAVLELYEAIGQTSLPLYHILSSDYFYTYLFNYGLSLIHI